MGYSRTSGSGNEAVASFLRSALQRESRGSGMESEIQYVCDGGSRGYVLVAG